MLFGLPLAPVYDGEVAGKEAGSEGIGQRRTSGAAVNALRHVAAGMRAGVALTSRSQRTPLRRDNS